MRVPLNLAGESYHPASEVFHFRCFVTLLGQLGSPGGRPLTLHAGCVSPLLGLPLGVPLLWGPLLGSPFWPFGLGFGVPLWVPLCALFSFGFPFLVPPFAWGPFWGAFWGPLLGSLFWLLFLSFNCSCLTSQRRSHNMDNIYYLGLFGKYN